jgi:hypothetical protein
MRDHPCPKFGVGRIRASATKESFSALNRFEQIITMAVLLLIVGLVKAL